MRCTSASFSSRSDPRPPALDRAAALALGSDLRQRDGGMGTHSEECLVSGHDLGMVGHGWWHHKVIYSSCSFVDELRRRRYGMCLADGHGSMIIGNNVKLLCRCDS